MARERTTFTAWITKYSLTEGILEKQVQDCFDISEKMVTVVGRSLEHYHGNDWHRTKAAAVVRAKQMQEAKLKSIDKQRIRIAALEFKV